MSMQKALRDSRFMALAIECAQKAALEGEIPVGAVCVLGDEIISTGRNRREACGNALAHAEIEAISLACERLGGWHLWQCELFVTLEPCCMCAGAIANARIKSVVYGTSDPGQSGKAPSGLRGGCMYRLIEGEMQEKCSALLKAFFDEMRAEKKTSWKPSGRIIVGEELPYSEDTEYILYAAAVAKTARGYILERNADGEYDFPSALRIGKSPARSIKEKYGSMLVPERKLLTLVIKQRIPGSANQVKDTIYILCKFSGEKIPDGFKEYSPDRDDSSMKLTPTAAEALKYL